MESDLCPLSAGLTLVTGPSRSGKSRWAEHLVADLPKVTYVATSMCRPDDINWHERLRRHRLRRPSHWGFVECGPNLLSLLEDPPNHALLIDSLGGHVAQHLNLSNSAWRIQCEYWPRLSVRLCHPVVLVIEETGWGVVPATAAGCLFRERLGELAQCLDNLSHCSWLVIQGRALKLTSLGLKVP